MLVCDELLRDHACVVVRPPARVAALRISLIMRESLLQLRPVGGTSVPAAAVRGNLRSSQLVRAFLTIELEGQHRSEDPMHTENIDAIRGSSEKRPIKACNMAPYNVLRGASISSEPDLFMAPVLTTENLPRLLIIKERMKLFAFRNRRVVITWRAPIVGANRVTNDVIISSLTAAEFEQLSEDNPQFLSRFCVGCPMMELRNVSICHGK
jgi:hypothetical protein